MLTAPLLSLLALHEPAPPPPPRVAAPAPAPAPVHVAAPPRNGRGLLWTGIGLAAGGYLLTSFFGAITVDLADDSPRMRRLGRSLLIPVAGPFIAVRDAESATAAWALTLAGGMQATGVALAIAGAVRGVQYRRWQRARLSAFATPSSGQVQLSVRF